MKRSGFSIVELSVVLLVLAMTAAAVTLRMESPLRHARMDEVIDAVGAFDALARDTARRQDRPLRLILDAPARQIRLADERGKPLPEPPLKLYGEFRIERLRVRNRDLGSQEVSIHCSRRGYTPTYALQLSDGKQRIWILTAGLTGQRTLVNDDKTVQDILATTGEGLYPN